MIGVSLAALTGGACRAVVGPQRRDDLHDPAKATAVTVDLDSFGPEAQQARMELIREITEFMKHAVPALKAYQENLNDPKALKALDQTPEGMEENQFWPDFMDERDDILTLKWFESQKEGKDIGFERALQMWVHWRPEQEADQPGSGT